MRIAISGSRTFEDRELVEGVVAELVVNGHHVLVGDARTGVDLFVREYFAEGDPALKVFVADWEANGKAAGHMRNAVMLAEAEGFIAIFANGKRTPGTSGALTIAERLGLPRRVYHLGRWTKYPGNAKRVQPLRLDSTSESLPPQYWFCSGCGAESPNGPDPDRLLIDTRFGKKHCRYCKKYTIWKVLTQPSTPSPT